MRAHRNTHTGNYHVVFNHADPDYVYRTVWGRMALTEDIREWITANIPQDDLTIYPDFDSVTLIVNENSSGKLALMKLFFDT